MKVSHVDSEGGMRFQIEGIVDIRAVASLQQSLCQALVRGGVIQFDLSGVVDCDVAGLQLMYAALRDLRAAGHSSERPRISDAIRRTASDIGLSLEEFDSAENPHVL
ncbi:MAG: STAS domain-containing protein [Acidobacteria bacterium]|nr:STAS domain-containing protein [Acidobacteriota bacterium]